MSSNDSAGDRICSVTVRLESGTQGVRAEASSLTWLVLGRLPIYTAVSVPHFLQGAMDVAHSYAYTAVCFQARAYQEKQNVSVEIFTRTETNHSLRVGAEVVLTVWNFCRYI